MAVTSFSISIIICTHGRAELLRECLDSLYAQSVSEDHYEVLVVNNNSTDHTPEVCQPYYSHHNFAMVFEPELGLSHARNRGYKEARADWVLYLDDDARAHHDMVERSLYTIKSYPFDCFGGRAFPVFPYGCPKWFPKDFEMGGEPMPVDFPTPLGEEDYFIGCIMAFKKSVLAEVNGFHYTGPFGKQVGYGDETELQYRLKERNFNLGYDPKLKVDHIVNYHKLDLTWHLKSKFAHGRDEAGIYFSRCPWHSLLYKLGRIGLVNLPKALVKLLVRRRYYWQNAVLETIGATAYQIGRYVGAKRLRATAK